MFGVIAKKQPLKLVLYILIIAFSFKGYSQLSKKHYIPPLTSSALGNANAEDQYIYLSTPSKTNISYTIIPVGLPATSYITGTVSNTTPEQIAIGSGNGQLFIPSTETSKIVNDRGFIIEAEAPIYVSVRMNAGGGAQAGALVSKGLSALGHTFRVGSYTNGNPQDNYLNFVSVMATEDNTQINFSNLPAGLIIKNYTGTTPINATLNEGESYTIATNCNEATVNQDGLIGCLIEANKPIVVNCGSTNGSFGTGNGRDYGIDQIVDVTKIGTEYIFVKGDGDNAWENILIVAHTDNTTISINGNASVTTINAGEYYVIEGHQYNANGNMYVETSQPVFAYQGVGGLGNSGTPNEANQGLFFVPPLSCETRGNLDNIANINNIGSTNYSGGITVVTKVGATITINGAPIGVAPNPVDGKPDYITYKVKGLNGNIAVQSDDELYCAYFNYNGSATSGSFYSGFPSAPEINFDAQFATLGNCIPNITLEAANTQSFDSFKWLFDDGSGTGFIDLMITTSTITPTLPGKYKLIGIITCTGEELESIEIPISVCPDDRDNDGIIDNIDIDNDNDGILNCTESKGNVTLDLSNTRPPILRFQDGTTDTSIATDNITINRVSAGTSSITLSNTGNITSNIPATTNGDNTYALTFSEPVNVKFSEDIAVTHTTINNEFFVAKILPVNKNITLLDPDDRLLIDSNFDGVFETGVTQISGSEIHFKFNPTPTGTTPYEFLANQVEGFTFVHYLENNASNSIFSGILSLTCFKNDNDIDGIKDAFDLDSDNDGIPDHIENQGQLIALSFTDTDLNGLDDVFNEAHTPIDTDNDGVLDFYDLDSDNDGIFDLIETGQLGTLSDTDLNGIEDGPTYGTNGWADNAETTPDSNEIGYTLNDLDNDTIFSYLDSDSDNDGCNDVIEAGFYDANNDAILGNTLATTNALGMVNNATDGYTIPNTNYLISAPLTITTQPTNTIVCQASNTLITMASTEAETYQWEVNTDGVNWNTITDNINYNNSQSTSLSILNTPLSFNTYKYRVKIDRNGNSCGLYSNEIELTVNPLPIVNSPVVLIQCDDDDLATLGFSPFNLTEANNKISTNATNEIFTYFLTEAAAISGDTASSNYINNPTTFENRTISSDTVWARIESALGCASVAQIQLNVSTTVVPSSFIVNFNQCDDFLDINGNDNSNNNNRDGIASFNFSSVSATITSFIPPGQTILPPRYYRNETDALAEINEITDPSNYRNIGYPDSQYIYVRIDSAISNDCLGLGAHILLNVEPLPVANTVTINNQCDDDEDGEYPFNTSQIETDVLGTQNPANFTVSYFDENGDTLPSPLPNPFITATQTITIRVTNNTTTAPDGPCYDETNVTFTVNKQPFANSIPDQIVCDGSSSDVDNDGLYPFNTSTYTSTILGSQIGMEIYYDYSDENGNLLLNQPSLPNPLNSRNQTINVKVVNPNNLECVANTTINLTVNPLPEFTVDTPRLVCSSDPTFSINLEPFEANPTEIFNYEWLWTSIDGTTVNQFVSNNRNISVSIPGTYSITLTKTDGSNCSKTQTIFVDASEKATITHNDVSIIDLSENNSVTINPTNLGMGNYEYALQEEGSTLINYQTEPFFNNIKPGFYTIHVKDNICGVSTLNISVIGYPKYFTPNGDGINDVWKIQGIDNRIQPNSTVLIFDRYGKLIKQLLVQDAGWDGTFNGNILLNDDYWFKVFLEDGRTFSGHFTLKR
ncbi:T9SS type B sorting domain-containing protein [Algibacter sp. PT7-4]|uniref:T9SS type B sorting domain-containing protein n=1 Tax=Algibacter ulvanivorans TaxID=3400999 RepID=UPI003AAAE1E1